MGRGLSDLQKTILRLAYHNMTTEGRPPSKVTVEVRKLPRQVAPDVTKKDLESLPRVGEGVEERIEERQRWREFVESEGPTNLVEQGRHREAGLFAERPKKYREKDHNRYTRRCSLAIGHGGVRLTKAGAEKGKELIEEPNG